ncbi:hypothetical protein SAMN05444416_109145 [Thermoactinomyces sp. DSM 45892]|nr:hypothetical protein SAMN05444416_109145 [Thermoactinomyces sp. DSM 45892]
MKGIVGNCWLCKREPDSQSRGNCFVCRDEPVQYTMWGHPKHNNIVDYLLYIAVEDHKQKLQQ